MKIYDIQGKDVHINKRTIVLKNTLGKTAGMITSVTSFYSMPFRDQLQYISPRAKSCGVKWQDINWANMFFIDQQWYYLFSVHRLKWAEEFRYIDGDKPLEKIKQDRENAERFGAEIIEVNKITDTREPKHMNCFIV